jgi:hypothetical protein
MHHLYIIILLLLHHIYLYPITLNLTLITMILLTHIPTLLNLLIHIPPQVIIINNLSEKPPELPNLHHTFKIINATLFITQFHIHLSLLLHHLLLVSTLYLLIYLIIIFLQLKKILFLIFPPTPNPLAMMRP